MTTGDNYLLADHPFLADLPQHWLQRLSVQAHPVVYQGGRRLFSERRPAERFWLLRSGRVALDLHVAGRGYVVIEWLDAGTVLGWSWLFPPFRWQFGAIAAEQTHAIEFSAAGVRRLVAEDAELGRELTTRCMSVVVDRLQASRTRLLIDCGAAVPGQRSRVRPAVRTSGQDPCTRPESGEAGAVGEVDHGPWLVRQPRARCVAPLCAPLRPGSPAAEEAGWSAAEATG